MAERIKVWVIDDDRSIRWVLEKALQTEGMEVASFASADGVMETLSADRPDAIVSDIRMPELDGLDVLAGIKKQSPDTPVLVVSGTGVMADAVEALRLGAWDFLRNDGIIHTSKTFS